VTDYQVMPALTADEYATLKADIAERGVLVPVVEDQHGNIVDGHHRKRIADELSVPCPVERRTFTDEQARDTAFALNLARRHLTREQKRELIAREIGLRPDDSDRAIGRRLGADHKTVGSVRRELSGEIPHPELTTTQRREAHLLFGIMRARTTAMCARIRDAHERDEYGWAMWTTYDVDTDGAVDPVVNGEASRRYTDWAYSAEETEGVMWSYIEYEEAS